jgi:two-component system, chemotaxis family, chemotaxis protein CheY
LVSLGIADDEPDILKLFRIMLGRKGYPIAYLARNGNEAVEMQRATPAGIVVIDHIMPHKDGIEASKEILGEFPDTKIFLMTCGEDIFESIKSLKDVTIVKKPFAFKAMFEMLDRAGAR